MPVQLPPPAIANAPFRSLYRLARRGLALFLVALLLNVTLFIPSAQAAILNWPSLPNWAAGFAPGSFQVFPPAPTTINGVRVRLTFTGDPIISDVQNVSPPPFSLTGGANPTGTLALLIDGATRDDSITATYRYEDPNGNLVPVENARFVVLDIDTSSTGNAAGRNWNDQVIFRGRNEFLAADVVPTLQDTINPIPGLVAVGTPATCPGPLPATQTVPPPAIFPTANSANTYTPLIGTVGGNPAASGRQLPGNGDSNNPWEARNNCSNGSVIATYPGAITSASFDYGYGPLTTTASIPGGPLNNGGPANQGIGFYNLFFTPVIIGTAKTVTNVVRNADGSSNITYQVRVENYGEVDLRNVNVTENLVNTFTNASSFNVLSTRIVNSTRSNITTPFAGVANAGFNGNGNDQLIAPGFNNPDGVILQGRVLGSNNAIVEQGGTVTLEFDVRVVPNPANPLGFGPFENQVEAEGFSVNTGQRVTDLSTDGTNPDSNGNDSPADDNTPTVVNLAQGLIGTAKDVASIVSNPDGTFLVTYRVLTENLGTVPLTNVRLVEDLTGTFAAANSFSVVARRRVGNTGVGVPIPNVNPAFTGSGNNELLDGVGTLSPGGTVTVEFDVLVDPGTGGNGYGPFNNNITAIGTDPNGTPTQDVSTAGAQVDPNNDGNPDEDDPTTVVLGNIGTAKAVTNVVEAGGIFTITYRVVTTNLGTFPLTNVRLVEDLTGTFANAAGFTVTDRRFIGSTGGGAPVPAVNPGFTGQAGGFELLDGLGTLNPGGTLTVEFDVDVTPGAGAGGRGPFDNNITAIGRDPSGNEVRDISTAGLNPDPNNDGKPVENIPTTVSLSEGVIGTAKAVTNIVSNPDGSFTLTYQVFTQNYGPVTLRNIQLVENLTGTFAAANSFTVTARRRVANTGTGVPIPNVNNAFNGNTNRNLLDGLGTLEPGDTVTVEFDVRVVPGAGAGGFGPFDNFITAQGTDPNGTVVQDLSTSGLDPDPDGDGNPSETSPTIASLPFLSVVKRITNIFRNGVAQTVAGINAFNDQPGTTADNALNAAFNAALGAASPFPTGIFQLPGSFRLETGDQVEYTTYFWNPGNTTLNNVALCDELQPPSVLDVTSYALQGVGALTTAQDFNDAVGGQIDGRSPLDTIDAADPLEAGCISGVGAAFPSAPPGPPGGLGVGAGGGVVAGQFTVPSRQFGAIRFRITVP